jgi:hypothetical protein
MPRITLEATLPHYAAVGRVAASWAEFEHQIQILIWNLAGLDDSIGACITSQVGNSSRLLDCMLAILRLRGKTDKDLKPLQAFCGQVAEKQRRRNRIIHDPWFFRFEEDGSSSPHRLEMSAAKRLVYRLISEDPKSINTFIAEISQLTVTLRQLLDKLAASS